MDLLSFKVFNFTEVATSTSTSESYHISMFTPFFIDDTCPRHHDLCSASLSRVWSLEHFIHLLPRSSLRFDKEEIYEDEFKDVPEHKEDIKPIADILQCHRCSKGIDKARDACSYLEW